MGCVNKYMLQLAGSQVLAVTCRNHTAEEEPDLGEPSELLQNEHKGIGMNVLLTTIGTNDSNTNSCPNDITQLTTVDWGSYSLWHVICFREIKGLDQNSISNLSFPHIALPYICCFYTPNQFALFPLPDAFTSYLYTSHSSVRELSSCSLLSCCLTMQNLFQAMTDLSSEIF